LPSCSGKEGEKGLILSEDIGKRGERGKKRRHYVPDKLFLIHEWEE